MKVMDNFIKNKKVFKSIQNHLLGSYFPWYYNSKVASDSDTSDYYYNHILFNEGYQQSSYFKDVAEPILNLLKFNELLRVQVNCFQKKTKILEHKFHVDRSDSHMVALFYVNTNNAYTLFKNRKKIKSVANRIIIFKGDQEHKSSAQTDTDIRVNVNINYR